MFRLKTAVEVCSRPEIELLLCCARRDVDAAIAGRIRDLVMKPIDWEYLLRTAFAHGVMPLLYKNLNEVCPDAVPGAVRDKTRETFQAHVQRNLFLTAELLKLVQEFADHGIAALPYKGPVLAASVYGDISLRSFTDLDILVDKGDVLRAKDLILSRGYRLSKPLTNRQEAARLRSRNEKDLAFVDLDDFVKVELHWEVASLALFPFETKALWERLEEIDIGGTRVFNLPPEDLLLTLCVHGAKHFFARLEWICDIAELLAANPRIRWDAVIEQATRLRTRRMLFLGLVLARDLLGSDLPAEVLQGIQADRETGLLGSKVQAALFSEMDSSSTVFKRDAYVIALREGWRDRTWLRVYYLADYLVALVKPNAADRGAVQIPSVLSFLYYLLRPMRLIKVYGVTAWAYVLRQVKHRVS